MKILQINDYGFILGGAEKYFFSISEELEKQGHQVVTISSNRRRNNKDFLTDYQILESGHCFNLDSYFNFLNYFQLKKIIKKEKPDVVHLHNTFYALSPSVLFACRGVKTFVTLHDYYAVCARDKRDQAGKICQAKFSECQNGCRKEKKIFQYNLKRKIVGKGLKNTNLLLAPSNYLKEEFLRNGYENVTYLSHPYTFQERKSSKEKTFSKDFLYLGRLAEQKGVSLLIEAFAKLEDKEAKLHIAGEGPEKEKLEVLAKKLEVNDRITFHGWVNEDKKHELFEKCIANVLPALWPEVAGLSIYEAAENSLISIASKAGGIPDFIEDKKTGILFQIADVNDLISTLKFVIDNPEKTLAIANHAREKALSYSMNEHIQELCSLYKT